VSKRASDGPTPWESLTPWEKAVQWRASAPEIADEVIAIARTRAEHERQLEISREDHRQKMDTRLWYTQLVTLLTSCVGFVVLAIIVVAVGPDAAGTYSVLGVSAGLTGASYVASRSIKNTWSNDRRKQQPRQG
jgi:hypothetical protein